MTMEKIKECQYYLHNNKHDIKKLIVITKNHKVIDFKDEL